MVWGFRKSLSMICLSGMGIILSFWAIETLPAQEKPLPTPHHWDPHPTNYLEESELGALPIIRDYRR